MLVNGWESVDSPPAISTQMRLRTSLGHERRVVGIMTGAFRDRERIGGNKGMRTELKNLGANERVDDWTKGGSYRPCRKQRVGKRGAIPEAKLKVASVPERRL